jgi:hypothetical protein
MSLLWAVGIFTDGHCAGELDISKASESTRQELGQLVPMYEELAHTAKVHLLQSTVSRILVDMIFDSYFVGLSPEQAAQCLQMEHLLASFGMKSPTGTLAHQEALGPTC